ncbi:hypothetical protein Tco_0448864 [Tanacetum coccineum]
MAMIAIRSGKVREGMNALFRSALIKTSMKCQTYSSGAQKGGGRLDPMVLMRMGNRVCINKRHRCGCLQQRFPGNWELLCVVFPEETDKIIRYVGWDAPTCFTPSVVIASRRPMQEAIEWTESDDRELALLLEIGRNQEGCGAPGHFKKDCPQWKNKNQGNGNGVARAYAVGVAGQNPDNNVVMEINEGLGLTSSRAQRSRSICYKDVRLFWHILRTRRLEDKVEEDATARCTIINNFHEVLRGLDWSSPTRPPYVEVSHRLVPACCTCFIRTSSSQWELQFYSSRRKMVLYGCYQPFEGSRGRISKNAFELDMKHYEFQVYAVVKNKAEHKEHLKIILVLLRRGSSRIESIKIGHLPKTHEIRQFLGLAWVLSTIIKCGQLWLYSEEVKIFCILRCFDKGFGCLLMQRENGLFLCITPVKDHERLTTHDLEIGAVGVRSKDLDALSLLSDYDCDIRYHPGKANVIADALSRKEREPPLRVRALVMTISLDLPKQILNAQTEARKPENIKSEDVGVLDLVRSKGRTSKTIGLLRTPELTNGSGTISRWILSQSFLSSQGYDTIWESVAPYLVHKVAIFIPMKETDPLEETAENVSKEVVNKAWNTSNVRWKLQERSEFRGNARIQFGRNTTSVLKATGPSSSAAFLGLEDKAQLSGETITPVF